MNQCFRAFAWSAVVLLAVILGGCGSQPEIGLPYASQDAGNELHSEAPASGSSASADDQTDPLLEDAGSDGVADSSGAGKVGGQTNGNNDGGGTVTSNGSNGASGGTDGSTDGGKTSGNGGGSPTAGSTASSGGSSGSAGGGSKGSGGKASGNGGGGAATSGGSSGSAGGGSTGSGGKASGQTDNEPTTASPATPPATPQVSEVLFSIVGNEEWGVIVAPETVVLKEGDTVADVLIRAAKAHRLAYGIRGTGGFTYVEGIDGLYEFDNGPLSGWKYRVNGQEPDISAGAYKPEPGDSIEWFYASSADNADGAAETGKESAS